MGRIDRTLRLFYRGLGVLAYDVASIRRVDVRDCLGCRNPFTGDVVLRHQAPRHQALQNVSGRPTASAPAFRRQGVIPFPAGAGPNACSAPRFGNRIQSRFRSALQYINFIMGYSNLDGDDRAA